jgi:hypothetical protein
LRRALAFAVLVGSLAGCGGDDGSTYPDEAVEAFVSECRAQPKASEASCRCVIERLQVSMPYEEFRRADDALRNDRAPADASVAKLQAAAEACLAG